MCFDSIDCQDMKYCAQMNNAQDCYDVDSYGSHSDHMYQGAGVGRYPHYLYCCSSIGRGEHLYYCYETKKSKHCFGCVNMRDKEYCIFNKQYSKEQYEKIVPQLIEQMQKNGTR